MPRILLVLNKANRESEIMDSIRRELLDLDPAAEVLTLPYDHQFFDRVLAFRPQTCLTFPMTSKGLSPQYYVFKHLFGTKIVCFRREGIFDGSSEENVGFHVGYDRYGERLVDYEIFWGPGPASAIGAALLARGKLSSPDRIKYCGYPRLERYFGAPRPERTARLSDAEAHRIDSFPRERVVLLATGFHFANYTREMLFRAGDLDAENRSEELLKTAGQVKEFRGQWIQAARQAAARHADTLLVLKKHPLEGREDYAALEGIDNVLYVSQDVDIGDLIERAGLFLHYGSTAVADSYLAGVPTIYVYSRSPRLRSWYTDMGWPSARSIACDEIPDLIADFRAGRIPSEDRATVQKVLESNFNIKSGHDYQPSREIATLLLQDDPAQRVPLFDVHFWPPISRHYYLKLRRLIGRPIKKMLGLT